MDNKFYVDERGGCIAVRQVVDYKISPGCHPDLPDVVAHWSGTSHYDDKGMIEWSIQDWQRNKAVTLCDQLNSKGTYND